MKAGDISIRPAFFVFAAVCAVAIAAAVKLGLFSPESYRDRHEEKRNVLSARVSESVLRAAGHDRFAAKAGDGKITAGELLDLKKSFPSDVQRLRADLESKSNPVLEKYFTDATERANLAAMLKAVGEENGNKGI